MLLYPAISFFFGVQFISEFECRQWSFVLLPDRPTRLIGHTRCFKSWINEFKTIALKFKPLVAFSRPLCDLPFRGSRRATFLVGQNLSEQSQKNL